MHRAAHPTTTRRRVLGARVVLRSISTVVGLGLAVLLAGCGAGQITQTDTQQSGVNGANANAGPIALRDVQLAAPSGAQSAYQPGSNAVLIATIVNTGLSSDTLLKVTTPAAGAVLIDGSPNGTVALPGNFAVSSGQDKDDTTGTSSQPAPSPVSSAPTTTSPAGSASVPPPAPSQRPLPPGTSTIVLSGMRSINGGPLRPGMTIPITFIFAHAGQVTIQNVPVGAPADGTGVLNPSGNG